MKQSAGGVVYFGDEKDTPLAYDSASIIILW